MSKWSEYISTLSPAELALLRAKAKTRNQKYYRNNYYIILAQHRAYAAAHPERVKQWQITHYQNNKQKMLARSKAYAKAHRPSINERNRERNYEKLNLPIPPKVFSFYRDVLAQKTKHDPIWQELFQLNLTAKQRQAILLASNKVSQVEQAQELNCNQSTVSRIYSAIHKKLLKSRAKNK